MTPQEVAAILQEYGSDDNQEELDGPSRQSDIRLRRTELLSKVLATCKDAWSTKSELLDLVAEKLGDGSRDVAWRLPYGDSGILDFFLGVLAEGAPRPKLHIHSLRLTGNSCADTDENRARVVQQNRLLSITKHVEDENMIPFNIPVIYNILVDYEPAQALASKSCLSKQLVDLLSLPHISKYSPFVPYICKILALLVSQEGECAVADPSTVEVLLKLATQPKAKEDADDFVAIVTVAVAYLANEDFQSSLVSEVRMRLFMDVFYHAHVAFNVDSIDDPDTVSQLKQLRISLLTTLADVSGNDAFAAAYPLSSLSDPVPQSFLAWIRGDNPSLQSAGCLALGNLSRSDNISIALVDTYKAHEPLVSLLSSSAVTDTQLLHAACSFLRNLAIPKANKPQLRGLLRPQCVPRIYSLDTLPQIQFAAASLTRLLLLNCPTNFDQICAVTDANPTDGPVRQASSANDLISLFGRSDAEPTKLEAARCVASICRILHSPPPVSEVVENPGATDDSDESKRRNFYKDHHVEKSLRFLTTQDKWPSLRSEAWFVFALMSRSESGARVVLSVLDDKAAESVLVETITGQKPQNNRDADAAAGVEPEHSASNPDVTCAPSELQLEPQQADPKQKEGMARADRENALFLCTALLKISKSELAPEKLALLQSLVRDGTQLLVADRTKAPFA
ncbi:Armadillo-type fold protein [Metarhizium album ARSEF 1941]|uniref:Armadillo-type fold protein n=1 Tax=Metarhizium album (strain ARSEF 1941) TaxID=1081103 RepID=A0A0B2WZ87_METAS|nr:Armadillo-type fold protein [Metarhizium album ARSEF 1941]KHO01612.1 Armadillo-type fold protein [Metarhizium album ARSEF 1941]